jgi:hypothetical protein
VIKLTTDSLARLPLEAELRWVFRSGSEVRIHRALMKKHVNKSLLLHVFFDGSTPDAARWSLVTNQPLHQWRGYTGGEVWLELGNPQAPDDLRKEEDPHPNLLPRAGEGA